MSSNQYTLVFEGEPKTKIAISEDLRHWLLLQGEHKYEDLIIELITEGRVYMNESGTVEHTLPDGTIISTPKYDEVTEKFNTAAELFHYLNNSFDCELISSTVSVFSVKADGPACGFGEGIMPNSLREHIQRISKNLGECSNDDYFDQRTAETSGSYTVDVLDTEISDTGNKQLIDILQNITDNGVDPILYGENENYKKLINEISKLSKKQGLDYISVNISMKKFSFNAEDITKIDEDRKEILHKTPFAVITNSARATDFSRKKFMLDVVLEDKKKTLHCKCEKIDIVKFVHDNLGKKISFEGCFDSEKTVLIHKASPAP